MTDNPEEGKTPMWNWDNPKQSENEKPLGLFPGLQNAERTAKNFGNVLKEEPETDTNEEGRRMPVKPFKPIPGKPGFGED